jgi:integrase
LQTTLDELLRTNAALVEQVRSLTATVERLSAVIASGALAPAKPAEPTITVAELAPTYLKSVEFRQLRSAKTEEGRIRLHIVRLLGDEQVMQVRAKIPDYRDTRATEERDNKRKRKTTPATRNREVIRLSAMCTWAVENKVLPSNPLSGIAMEAEVNERRTSPNPDDVYRLLFVARPRLKAIIATAFWSGLRREEVCRLPIDQVLWDDGLIVLRGVQTKSGRPRATIFPDIASKWVRDYLDEREADGITSRFLFCTGSGLHVSGRNVLRDYQDAWDRAGLEAAEGERPWFHDLRSGFVGHQLELGTPEKVIMEMTGHSTHEAFDRYVRVKRRWIDEARARAEVADAQRRPAQRVGNAHNVDAQASNFLTNTAAPR